jgi:type II secretory pathway pseudopilin PulG
MSGVVTIASIATAAAAVGSTVMGAVQGGRQADAQEKALKSQKTAQGEAKAAALSTQRKADLAANEANQKTPDIASILARAAKASKSGLGSTMLTGPSGVDSGALNLGGGTTLLGS